MNNPMIAKIAQTITLKDNQLIKKENPSLNTKTRIKKAVDIKKDWPKSKSRPNKKPKQKTQGRLR